MTQPSVRPLSADLQKAAIEQLEEDPARIAADIEALKTWIQQEPYLRARTDDQFLLAFLRGCKHSLERAKAKIEQFYTFRTKFPNMYACYDVDAPALREALRMGVFFFLPTPLHENGSRLFLFRIGKFSPDRCSGDDIIRIMHVMQEITMIEDDYAVINGIRAVVDIAGTTTTHLFYITPSMMGRMGSFAEQALPFRPQGAHFINVSGSFERLFNMLKSILSEKQKNRIFFHSSNLEALYETVPQQYLPKEYGGSNSSVDEIIAYWERKLDEYRDYFKANAEFGIDEKLKLEQSNSTTNGHSLDGTLGLDGSFRMLNVD